VISKSIARLLTVSGCVNPHIDAEDWWRQRVISASGRALFVKLEGRETEAGQRQLRHQTREAVAQANILDTALPLFMK